MSGRDPRLLTDEQAASIERHLPRIAPLDALLADREARKEREASLVLTSLETVRKLATLLQESRERVAKLKRMLDIVGFKWGICRRCGRDRNEWNDGGCELAALLKDP